MDLSLEEPGQLLQQHGGSRGVGTGPVVDEVELPGEQGAVEIEGEHAPHLHIVRRSQAGDDGYAQPVFHALQNALGALELGRQSQIAGCLLYTSRCV